MQIFVEFDFSQKKYTFNAQKKDKLKFSNKNAKMQIV